MGSFKKKRPAARRVGRHKNRSTSRRHKKMWQRRLAKTIAVTAIASLLMGGGLYAWQQNWVARSTDYISAQTRNLSVRAGFKVEDILITGRQHISADTLRQQLGINPGTAMIDVDLVSAQEKLMMLPWVEQAVVSRRLPDTLLVGIVERRPAALWQYQKKVKLIDINGHVLEITALENWQHLPLVVGAGADQNIRRFLSLVESEPLIAKKVVSAVYIGNRRWDLHLKGQTQVLLPEKEAPFALARLARAEKQKQILNKNLITIDLRLPDRMVVKPDIKKGEKNTI